MTETKKKAICAYRMAKSDWWHWRMQRAWSRSGDAFLMEAAATAPTWPPFRQRWQEWLEAYDNALEADRD